MPPHPCTDWGCFTGLGIGGSEKEIVMVNPESTIWTHVAFPPRGTVDSIFLILNLVPLALSAVIRAALWYMHIPLIIMDGWTSRHRRSVAWFGTDGRRVLEEERGKDSSWRPLQVLVEQAIRRGAHRFPHSHGRPFPHHLEGIAALVHHWKQPAQPDSLCVAALLHSAYSTEMFPWGLYEFSERGVVRDLIGALPESIIFLYCTVSQTELYREVLRLTALGERIPGEGLKVRNCQTGEELRVPARQAARVLVLLGADIAEQDPYFDLHLVASLVRLAAPHLDHPPLIASELDKAAFFNIGRAGHAALCQHAKRLLSAENSANLEELKAAAVKSPWLYELGVEACKRSAHQDGDCDVHDLRLVSSAWCEAWGTPWSRVAKPDDEIHRVRGILWGR